MPLGISPGALSFMPAARRLRVTTPMTSISEQTSEIKMPATKGLKRTALAALIPGTKFDPKTFEVSAVADPDAPTVVFNVRGTIFETYRSNLYRKNLSNLSNEEFLGQFYRVRSNDYFFDRDPSLFSSVLEYQRTGVLHIPVNVCGKVARQELEFWGIDESCIEKCCWSTFDSWNSTYDALKQLEEAQNRTFNQYTESKIAGMKYGKMRAAIWNFLSNPRSSNGAKIYSTVTITFIILSVISFIVVTHPCCRIQGDRDFFGMVHLNETREQEFTSMPHPAFIVIDLVCLAFFTCDLAIKYFSYPNRKLFFINVLNLVDIASVLPDFIAIFISTTLDVEKANEVMHYVNILGLFRSLRIFRLARYVPGLWILFYTFKASIWDLLLMNGFMMVGMIVFATLIYHAEDDNFNNIPISLWWALVTMTTVGYGDMFPSNFFGYIVGSLCAITGVLMVAFTVPIIVNNFLMYYTYYIHIQSKQELKRRREKHKKNVEKTEEDSKVGESEEDGNVEKNKEDDNVEKKEEDGNVEKKEGG